MSLPLLSSLRFCSLAVVYFTWFEQGTKSCVSNSNSESISAMEKTLPGSQLVYVSETRGLSSVFGDRLVLYRYSGKLLSAFLKPKCYQISYKTSLSHVLSVFDKAAETVGKFMQG